MKSEMNLLLLPGMSPANQAWIDEIGEKLSNHFPEVVVQHYDHWENGGGFKLGAEKQKIQQTTNKWDKYMVVAKSVGVGLTLDCVKTEIIKPDKCVFVGTTSKSAQMLSEWKIPTLFIQENNDPFLHAKDLKPIANGLADADMVQVEGNRHRYEDVNLIVKSIIDHSKSNSGVINGSSKKTEEKN